MALLCFLYIVSFILYAGIFCHRTKNKDFFNLGFILGYFCVTIRGGYKFIQKTEEMSVKVHLMFIYYHASFTHEFSRFGA